jgi:hypothetical protein
MTKGRAAEIITANRAAEVVLGSTPWDLNRQIVLGKSISMMQVMKKQIADAKRKEFWAKRKQMAASTKWQDMQDLLDGIGEKGLKGDDPLAGLPDL